VANETDVTIVLKGVRVERLDRLKTTVRSVISSFARSFDISTTEKKPKKEK